MTPLRELLGRAWTEAREIELDELLATAARHHALCETRRLIHRRRRTRAAHEMLDGTHLPEQWR